MQPIDKATDTPVSGGYQNEIQMASFPGMFLDVMTASVSRGRCRSYPALGWIISDGINYAPPWLDYFYYRARPSPRSHQQQQPLIPAANRFQMLIASPRLGGGDGS